MPSEQLIRRRASLRLLKARVRREKTGVEIVVTTPSAVSFFGGPADASGCIDISWNGFITTPGTYYASAYQYVHNDRHADLMASTSFDVIPAG